MKKLAVILSFVLVLMTVAVAQAIPNLQLEIIGGSYIDGTYYNNSDPFILRAYLIEDKTGGDPLKWNLLGDTYFISAAVVPPQLTSATLGSFSFAGTDYNATSSMELGTPPLDTLYPNLPGHGIYETYYKEFTFTFNNSQFVTAYNVADPTDTKSVNMYYADFTVDLSNLVDQYGIHFDLYNENLKEIYKKGTWSTGYDTLFAPFSHDAEGHKVPEPSSLWLMGMGLLGLGFFARKRK